MAGKPFGDYALSRSGPVFKQKLKKDKCFYIVIFLY